MDAAAGPHAEAARPPPGGGTPGGVRQGSPPARRAGPVAGRAMCDLPPDPRPGQLRALGRSGGGDARQQGRPDPDGGGQAGEDIERHARMVGESAPDVVATVGSQRTHQRVADRRVLREVGTHIGCGVTGVAANGRTGRAAGGPGPTGATGPEGPARGRPASPRDRPGAARHSGGRAGTAHNRRPSGAAAAGHHRAARRRRPASGAGGSRRPVAPRSRDGAPGAVGTGLRLSRPGRGAAYASAVR